MCPPSTHNTSGRDYNIYAYMQKWTRGRVSAEAFCSHKMTEARHIISTGIIGNAMHAVRTQCEVLDVGKYSSPRFGPFSQVFGSVPGFLLAS